MDNLIFLVFAGVIAIVVTVLVLGYYAEKKRMEGMRAVAARLGYGYVEQDVGLAGTLAGFGLLSRGHSHRATNALSTEVDGATAAVVDYRYEIGHGKHRQTYRQSVLLFESGRLNLPAFVLRPEGLGQKLAGLLGQQDIDFEHQPDFSAAYLLQGPDEQSIRALFGNETLAFFTRRPGLCIEGQRRRLLYYRAHKLVAPEAVAAFLEEGLAVLHLLAGKEAPPPATEPDPLAGLDEVLVDLGIEEGAAVGGE